MTAFVLEADAPGDRLRIMTIAKAVDLWLGELERSNHSERTIDTYRRLLDKLHDDHPGIDVEKVTTEMVRRFLDGQGKKRNGSRKAPRTVAQNVSIVNGFFHWLTREGIVKRNPTERNGDRIISRPKLPRPDDNDNVTTIDSGDVTKLLAAADESGKWDRRLCVYGLAYLGPRRHALAGARIRDYDPEARTLTFHEKGGKTITKPCPHRLADLIDAARAAGVYTSPDDYLVPSRAEQRRKGDRDDRVIWRIVKDVAADADVTTHVHALRAAFAVQFLEQKPGQVIALKDLMGHARLETTLIYLRRRDRHRSMEVVRDLDYGTHVAAHDNETAGKRLESFGVAEKEGFEPSFSAKRDGERAGIHSEGSALPEALRGRIPRETEAKR